MQNPIVPVQSTAVVDSGSGLFARPWYLFFTSISPVLVLMQDAATSLTAIVNDLVAAKPVKKTQSQLVAFAATLNKERAGLLIEVTDYRHVLQWTGTAYAWGPGEDGRHDIVGLPIDPDDTTGWKLCDGTGTTYLKGDGSAPNYTTPDLISAGAYLKLGAPVSGPNAAVAPTSGGGAISSSTTGVTASMAGTATVQSMTVAGAGLAPTAGHVHPITVADPTHTHTISSITVGNDGEPRNVVLRPWFRR